MVDETAAASNQAIIGATPRVNLRAIFAFAVFIAIGLTVGRVVPANDSQDAAFDWMTALLSTASVAIIYGLVQESWKLGHESIVAPLPSELRQARLWAILWRLGLAAIILACVFMKALILHRVFEPPREDAWYFEDLLTGYVWLFAIIISLAESYHRVASPPQVRRFAHWINAVVWAGAVLLTLRLVIDLYLVPYLVHLACRGVDATLRYTGNRYPLPSRQDELLYFGKSAVAVLVYLLSLLALWRAFKQPNFATLRRLAWLALGFALLAAAAWLGWWYRAVGLPQVSPDIGGTGSTWSWYLLLGGALLAGMTVTVGAHVVCQTQTLSALIDDESRTTSMRCAVPTLACILLASIAFSALCAISFFDLSLGLSQIENVAALLLWPQIYFFVAMLVLSARLLKLRLWNNRRVDRIALAPFSFARFLAVWPLLGLILGIGMLTLSAFGFAFWLGPWYRW